MLNIHPFRRGAATDRAGVEASAVLWQVFRLRAYVASLFRFSFWRLSTPSSILGGEGVPVPGPLAFQSLLLSRRLCSRSSDGRVGAAPFKGAALRPATYN